MRLWLVVPIILLLASCSGNGGDEDGDETTGSPAGESTTAASSPSNEEQDETPEPTDTPVPEPVNEDELARSLLLTINDFPTGWSETPSEEEEESPLDERCPQPESARTGRAISGDFSDENGNAEVSHTVAAFGDPADAEVSMESFRERAQCLVDAFNDGDADDDEVEFSGASLGTVSFPPFGDDSKAFRISVHAKRKGQSGFGSEADVYYDLVAVRQGRVAFSFVVADVFSPFNSSMLEELTRIATERVAAANP